MTMCYASKVLDQYFTNLYKRFSENLKRAEEDGVQSITLAEAQAITEVLLYGTVDSLTADKYKELFDKHKSLKEGMTGLVALLEEHSGNNSSCLMDLLESKKMSIYIGETRRELDDECYRWALQEGSYNGQRYLPNITFRDGTMLKKCDVRDTLAFKPIALVSVESRLQSRAIEGMLHEQIMTKCAGADHSHKTWLWKHASCGRYTHKYDHQYRRFRVFITAAPTLHAKLDPTNGNGTLEFQMNRKPKDVHGNDVTTQ